MSKPRPWDQEWTRGEQIGSGGHGYTYFATRKADSSTVYVMKVLRNQTDPERRERMFREVEALAGLDHPGIPKIIDSNTAGYANLSEQLFFVSDYIEGATLQLHLKEGRLPLEEAVRLTLSLAEILDYCHGRGILHRDVKPDNIIIRKESGEPVLIDFGQSFNLENEDSSGLTPTGQQLGNRFLHLPELQTGDSTKRHAESDISQCCAVLFFALTGFAPENLVDHEDRKPHQRARAVEVLGEDIPVSLRNLFDRGFERLVASRFHSFGAFKGALHEILDELRTGIVPSNVTAQVTASIDPVEALKNYVEAGNAGRLHDLLMSELGHFEAALEALGFDHSDRFSPEALVERLDAYERISAPLCRLAATGATWWLPEAEHSWIELIESLADLPMVSPVNPYWEPLRRYPALLVIYSAGIAACHQGRYDALKSILTGAQFQFHRGLPRDLAVSLLVKDRVFYSNSANLLPGLEQAYTPESERLFKALRVPLGGVIRRDAAYEAMFDRFEYLASLVYADRSVKSWESFWGPPGRFMWKLRALTNDHVVNRVAEELANMGENWPPLVAGLFVGPYERFETLRKGNLERLAKATNATYFR